MVHLNFRALNDHFSDSRTFQYWEAHFNAFPHNLRKLHWRKAGSVIFLLHKVVIQGGGGGGGGGQ
jgi:hypothetical protein